MAVTIKDLARETGLASSTISAYLNGTKVREDNAEKIKQAILKLGYIRNEYARGLKTHKSKTIGVLIPELSSMFSTTIITEIEEKLREQGYGIIVCDCRSNLVREKEAIKFLISKMVDGIIILPISQKEDIFTPCIENNIPVVSFDRMINSKKVSNVIINNREISYKATKKLLNENNKNIVIINGSEEVYTAKERYLGYKKAMEEANLYSEKYLYLGGLSIEGGYNAVKNAIKDLKKVDAFFVTNYDMTIGAIMAINEEGLKIGGDINLIGFDITDISKLFSPSLVSVVQPLALIGDRTAKVMLDMIEKHNVQNIILEAVIE